MLKQVREKRAYFKPRSKSFFQMLARLRSNKGVSLSTVLAMGTVSSLWVTSMMAVVLPTYQKSANLRSASNAKSAAEAALDYAIVQLNQAKSIGQRASIDCPGTIGSSKVTVIPGSVIGIAPEAQVTIVVESIPIGAPSGTVAQQQGCSLFDQQIHNLIQQGLENPYRRITVSAQIGNVARAIRVLLSPIINQTALTANNSNSTNNTNNNNTNNQSRIPFMPFAIMSRERTDLIGTVGINSYNAATNSGYLGRYPNDPRIRADFGALSMVMPFGSGNGYRGMALGGSLMEFSPTASQANQAIQAFQQQYSASQNSQSSWCSIMDNVYSNYPLYGGQGNSQQGVVYSDITNLTTNLSQLSSSESSGYWPRGASSPSVTTGTGAGVSGNENLYNDVFGVSNVMGQYPFSRSPGSYPDQGGALPSRYVDFADGAAMGGAVMTAQQYTAPSFPPVPTPQNPVPLGNNITLSGSSSITIMDGAPMPAAISNLSSGNVVIPPGDYQLNSLSMTGNAQIINRASSPTRLFVDGASTDFPVSIGNTCQVNMSGVTQIGTGFNFVGNNGVPGPNGLGKSVANNQHSITPQQQIFETSGSANNLQLLTSSSKNIVLNGKERMTVYAPNAFVSVGQSSGMIRPAEFFGAIAAYRTTLQAGFTSTDQPSYIHYDVKLKPQSGALLNPNAIGGIPVFAYNDPFLNPQTVSTSNVNQSIVSGYRASTWQESNGNTANIADITSTTLWQ